MTCHLEPLWSYVNLNTHSPKSVNVYLAPKNLLLAIFCEESVVDEIIVAREAIWKTIKTETYIDKLSLEQDFRKTFAQYIQEGIDVTLINFSIYMIPPRRKPLCFHQKESLEDFFFWHQ